MTGALALIALAAAVTWATATVVALVAACAYLVNENHPWRC